MGLDVQPRKEWHQALKLGCAQPLEEHMEELEDMEEQRLGIHSRWRNVLDHSQSHITSEKKRDMRDQEEEMETETIIQTILEAKVEVLSGFQLLVPQICEIQL